MGLSGMCKLYSVIHFAESFAESFLASIKEQNIPKSVNQAVLDMHVSELYSIQTIFMEAILYFFLS